MNVNVGHVLDLFIGAPLVAIFFWPKHRATRGSQVVFVLAAVSSNSWLRG